MSSERDRTQFVTKLLIALVVCILITIYNSFHYDVMVLMRDRLQFFQVKQKNATANDMKKVHIPEIPPKGYLVWNNNCHMLSMDPFDPIYMSDYKPQVAPNCTDKPPLIIKLFNASTKKYIIHIDMHLKSAYVKNDSETLECCYQKILRKSEKDTKTLNCVPFEQDFIVPNDIDYMLVKCSQNNTIVYQDGLFFIQERPKVREKLEKNSQNTHRPFGILLFGIDAVSQFNFRRVMPQTFQYLQNNSWFELSGYNKVDDNTYPNLMAIFTGYSLEKADEICNSHKYPLDNCTTLFKLFNEQNLITAYSEDECFMSTFTYLRKGFAQQPTDYYQRPLIMSMEDNLPVTKLSGLRFCLGPRRTAEHVYGFGVEFAERFLGKSIFGLFWSNSFSHNYWRDPHTMDERMVEFFNEMHEKDILENNVVVLFSDHGARWGFLRSEKDGYNEERLPMFFLRLPKWFQLKYPEFAEALKINKHRLTSPYDFHVTLKHLAILGQGKDIVDNSLGTPLSCPECHTLLKPVDENRMCKQAGISDHWCTCTPYRRMDSHSAVMQNITKLVIKEMNVYLNSLGYGKKCTPLEFKGNEEANLKLELHDVNPKDNDMQTYRMNFITNPNEALFDATLIYNKQNNSIIIDVPEISRLNVYAEDAKCITDNNIVKKFCICYESIKKKSR